MTDVTTMKPLQVLDGGPTGPYLYVPLDQVPDLRRLLDERGIRYSVQEHAISMNDGPFIAEVYFGRSGNLKSIQTVLDSVP